MTKLELIKALEQFNDNDDVVVSFDVRDIIKDADGLDCVAYNIYTVGDGWKPSGIADIQMGERIMG